MNICQLFSLIEGKVLAVYLIFSLVLCFHSPVLCESRASDPAKTLGGGGQAAGKAPLPSPEEKVQEQLTNDICLFVRNYYSYAGLDRVLENTNDLNRLKNFLGEYRQLGPSALSDQRLLRRLRVQIYEELARYLKSRNKISEVIRVQRKLLDDSPKDLRLRSELATLLSQTPEGYQEAASIYAMLWKENPKDLDLLRNLARLQAATNNHGEALKNYELLSKLRADDFSLKLEYVRFLAGLNQNEKALSLLKEIASSSPDFYAAKTEMVRLEIRLGDLTEADNQLKSLANDPKLPFDLKKEVYAIYRERIRKQDDLSIRRYFANMLSQDKRTLDASIAEYNEILKSGQADDGDRFALAKILSWNKNLDESLKLYEELIKSTSNSTQMVILAEYARVLRWTQHYQEAMAIVNRLLEQTPQSTEYKLEKARILSETRKFEESIKLYEEILQENSNQSSVRLEYAKVLNWSGQSAAACKEYERLLPVAPSSELDLEYARVLADQHRYLQSDRIYRKLIAERPEDRALRLEFAQSLAWRNDLAAAQEQFVGAMKDMVEFRKTFAKVLFWKGKYEEARAECLSLLNIRPDDTELRYDAARALIQLGRFEEAVNELEQLKEEFPADKNIAAEYKRAVDLKRAQAEAMDKAKKLSNEDESKKPGFQSKPPAKTSFQGPGAITVEPINTTRLPTPEELLEIERNKERLKLEPENDKLRLELANRLLWSKDYKKAIEMYRSILADTPDDREALLGLAEALLYLEEFSAAHDLFSRVLLSDPSNVRAHSGLAQIYTYGNKLPDPDRARKELKQLLAHSFTYLPAWETYEEIDRGLRPSIAPVSERFSDSDRFTRFSTGADFKHPFNSKTALVSSYRYHFVRQSSRPPGGSAAFDKWFGKDITGRSYSVGINQRVSSNAQLQATIGGTNFNGGLSFIATGASLDLSLHRAHLVNLSYQRQPGILYINSALGSGLYGDSFQLEHSYEIRRKWEFIESYRLTHLTTNRTLGLDGNWFREAQVSIRRRLPKNLYLTGSYESFGFRKTSPLYYSPRNHQALNGDLSYEKSNRRTSIIISSAAGRLLTTHVNGLYLAGKADWRYRFSDALELGLSYQPLLSRAGSVIGSNRYRSQVLMVSLRYFLQRHRHGTGID